MSTGPSPVDWRDDERYAYLSDLDRAGWAWEFLRRNPDYIAAHHRTAASELRYHTPDYPNVEIIEAPPETPEIAHWGLLYIEDPRRPASEAAVFWDVTAHPGVVSVQANPADRADPAGIDVRTLQCVVRVLQVAGREQVSATDGRQSVQLDIRSGSVLKGPVVLDYQFGAFTDIDSKLTAIHRLAHLCRTGRFPAAGRSSRQRHERWLMAVRALDLADSGATQREIAETLFGTSLTEQDWRTRSDYLRNRVRRLLRLGQSLSQNGYRQLLSL